MSKSQGFTLVELAVSIAIIGLLLVGTLGGVDMIKAGRLRKVASEFVNYKEAIDQFVSEYQYLPGDIPTAYSYWGATCGTNDYNQLTSCNGDGNTFIDWSASTQREDLRAWKHLGLAGLIQGASYTGTPAPSDNTAGYVLGTNAPKSDGIKGGVYLLGGPSSAAVFLANGIQIRLAAIGSASPYSPYVTGLITAKDAYSIDKKIDDGVPTAGQLYTMAAGDSGTNCVSSTSAAATTATLAAAVTYQLTNTAKDCQLVYWYKKF
jgi:prepilin-type N-terminal cleavage/methylation domain-containing protein